MSPELYAVIDEDDAQLVNEGGAALLPRSYAEAELLAQQTARAAPGHDIGIYRLVVTVTCDVSEPRIVDVG